MKTMSNFYIDGEYKKLTKEQYEQMFGKEPEQQEQAPTDAQRLEALEKAVADLALGVLNNA